MRNWDMNVTVLRKRRGCQRKRDYGMFRIVIIQLNGKVVESNPNIKLSKSRGGVVL